MGNVAWDKAMIDLAKSVNVSEHYKCKTGEVVAGRNFCSGSPEEAVYQYVKKAYASGKDNQAVWNSTADKTLRRAFGGDDAKIIGAVEKELVRQREAARGNTKVSDAESNDVDVGTSSKEVLERDSDITPFTGEAISPVAIVVEISRVDDQYPNSFKVDTNVIDPEVKVSKSVRELDQEKLENVLGVVVNEIAEAGISDGRVYVYIDNYGKRGSALASIDTGRDGIRGALAALSKRGPNAELHITDKFINEGNVQPNAVTVAQQFVDNNIFTGATIRHELSHVILDDYISQNSISEWKSIVNGELRNGWDGPSAYADKRNAKGIWGKVDDRYYKEVFAESRTLNKYVPEDNGVYSVVLPKSVRHFVGKVENFASRKSMQSAEHYKCPTGAAVEGRNFCPGSKEEQLYDVVSKLVGDGKDVDFTVGMALDNKKLLAAFGGDRDALEKAAEDEYNTQTSKSSKKVIAQEKKTETKKSNPTKTKNVKKERHKNSADKETSRITHKKIAAIRKEMRDLETEKDMRDFLKKHSDLPEIRSFMEDHGISSVDDIPKERLLNSFVQSYTGTSYNPTTGIDGLAEALINAPEAIFNAEDRPRIIKEFREANPDFGWDSIREMHTGAQMPESIKVEGVNPKLITPVADIIDAFPTLAGHTETDEVMNVNTQLESVSDRPSSPSDKAYGKLYYGSLNTPNKMMINVYGREENLKNDVRNGFHPPGCTSPKSVATHESGHLFLKGLLANPKTRGLVREMEDALAESSYTNGVVSEYCRKDPDENFCETYTALNHGTKAIKNHPNVQIVKKYMEDLYILDHNEE